MRARFQRHWHGPLAITVAALLLLGCNRTDELTVIASAKRHLDAEQAVAAALELKTLLQSRPDSAEGRFLLGKALLASGDPGSAEAELRRALKGGYAEAAVLPVLATTLMAQNKPDVVIKEFGERKLSEPAADAELTIQLALALATLDKRERAEQVLAALLERQPEHVPARLLSARMLAAKGDLSGARRVAESVLAKDPQNALAWVLKADLLQHGADTDFEAATAAYRQALVLRPKLTQAHSGLLTLLVRRHDLPGATQQLAALDKASPNHPQTLYFDAVIAHQRGDARRALELSQELLLNAPDNVHLLMLASAAQLQLGARAQAEALLEKAITAAPGIPELRRQLARVHLRSGRPDRALDTLRPLIEASSTDAEALSLAAQASLLAGDAKKSEQQFARAASLRPGDPEIRTAVAKSFLARGQVEPGLRELQAAAAADLEGSDADLTLIGARLKRNELDAAAKALDALVRKQPKDAFPEHLRGHIALLQGQRDVARQGFEAALAKDPRFFPSVARLAELDLAEQQPAAARARYETVLKAQPDHVASMLALGALARRGGGTTAEASAWLDKAVKVRPKDATTWAAAIDQHLKADDHLAAAALAQAAVAALPGQPELLERLARAQLLAGAAAQSIANLDKLQTMLPTSPYVRLLLADAHLANKDEASANLNVQAALALAPDMPGVQRSGAAIAIRRGRAADAVALARSVQDRNPADAVGFRLEGDAEASQKRWEAAAAAYRKALDKRNPLDAAVRYHFALLNGNKSADAAAFEKAWSKDHPGDAAFVNHLAEMALLRNDFASAEARFRRLLELRPDDVSGLNNLAYLLISADKPGGLPLAERAARLGYDRPDVLDTLALGHAQAGQLDKAVEWQLRALALAPTKAALRLNLARLYLRAGDKAKARAELQSLAKLGPSFSGQAEVEKLLTSAGG